MPKTTNTVMGILALLAFSCQASDDPEPPKIGNFVLPYSQQPGPFISFGENIIGKNQAQVYVFGDNFVGEQQHFADLLPFLLYGITDDLSLTINTPYALSYKVDDFRSSGFEDQFAQLEYAYYSKSTKTYWDQATILANISIPTGSIRKEPTTGFGSPGFFGGTTYNRTYIDWFVFGSSGAVVTTAKQGTKFGNYFLYQGGFGRNITDRNGWIFAWVTEFTGTYAQHNRFSGLIDPNSGGNIIFATPSLWASNKRFIFQLGAGLPIVQHLHGIQARNSYFIAADVALIIT